MRGSDLDGRLRCLCLAPLLALANCGGASTETRALDSGVLVEIQQRGDGTPAAADRMVVFHYDTRLPDGTLVDSSRGRPLPHAASLQEPGVLLPGLREGLLELREGDRARLRIPAALAYGSVGKGDIPPGSPLDISVELLAVARRTAAGTHIHVLEQGEGPPVGQGDHVVLQFRGFTEPSGREFWSSRETGGPLEFVIGEGQVLRGLEDAVQGLGPGGRAICLVPPELAYGEEGKLPDVPPGRAVWFELELMGVRRNR